MDKIENLTNSIHISWIPSFNCNFSCRYCDSEYHQKDAPISSLDQLKTIYYKLYPFISDKENIVIWFTGGEPSKVLNLFEFCKFLKLQNKSVKIGINSNGSASFDYYKNLLKYVDEIAFSVHFDFIKYKPYFKKLIKLIPYYSNRIHFCIMCDFKYMDQVKHSVKVLEKFKVKFSILRISGSAFKTLPEDEEFILQYSTNETSKTILVDNKILYSDHEFKNSLNNKYDLFNNWKCHVSSEHLFIKYDTLYAGECGIINYGNLLKDDIFRKDYIICDGRRCNCTADLRATKYNEISQIN